ncbi:MAG: hypothetical protein DWQ01_22045 [Planctomycetota bacterium]|nr:MAG: hypothetical protein DWQ01_22045 [Planctomycetota bacterium]
MTESPSQPNSGGQPPDAAIRRVQEEAPGSLLRLRDVQSLNRSFRRLAEVQNGLLEHLETAEEERRRGRRWALPVMTILGFAAGLGAGATAMAMWGPKDLPEDLRVQAEMPEIVVEPTPVTVELPESTLDPELLNRMQAMLEQERDARSGDQETIRELTSKLLERMEREQQTLAMLDRLAEGNLDQEEGAEKETPSDSGSAAQNPTVPAANGTSESNRTEKESSTPTAESSPGASPGAEAAAEEETWLQVLNGLLATDGYSGYRFQKGEAVPDQAQIRQVILAEYDAQGRLDNLLKAERVEFQLHQMSGTLALRFFDGHRSRAGVRIALPPEGARLDFLEVNSKAWLQHFPALAEAEVEQAAAKVPDAQLEPVRKALDGFLSLRGPGGYYRMNSLGGIQGNQLQLVQINWFDAAGRLVKTIEADQMEVQLYKKGTVELVLRNGAFVDGGQRSPFYNDLFRIYLTRQPVAEWQASEIPLVEVD